LDESPRGIGCLSAPVRRGPDGLEFEVQGIMFKVAPVSTKNLSLVNSSVRKISPALAGKCIAMAVECAGMAAEPEKVRRHFSFPRRYRVQYTCELYWSNNCETCTRRWQGSERSGKQGVKVGDFWNGRCCSFCRSSSCQWEQGSYFCKSWRPRPWGRGHLKHPTRHPRLEPCLRLSCGFLHLLLLSWRAAGK
jgi:hypothetical protein